MNYLEEWIVWIYAQCERGLTWMSLKMRPLPVKLGVGFLVALPLGALAALSEKKVYQYLADILNGIGMLGFGLIVAYALIDTFNARASRGEYKEIRGVLAERASSPLYKITSAVLGILIKAPNSAFTDSDLEQLAKYRDFFLGYFAPDRLNLLQDFGIEFEKYLDNKEQQISSALSNDLNYAMFDIRDLADTFKFLPEQVAECRLSLERLAFYGRLPSQFVEEILVKEQTIGQYFNGTGNAIDDLIEINLNKGAWGIRVWEGLRKLLTESYTALLYLEDFQVNTDWRNKLSHGDSNYRTSSSAERRNL